MASTLFSTPAFILFRDNMGIEKDNTQRATHSHSTWPTGIRALDKASGGGLPVPSGVVLRGPLGVGKTALGRQLVANCLRNGCAVLNATADYEAEEAMLALQDLGVNTEQVTQNGQLYFLDLFRMGAERLGTGFEAKPVADKPGLSFWLDLIQGELLQLVRRFAVRNLGRKQFGLMDSITPLLLTATGGEVYQFSQAFRSLLKFLNGVGIAILHEDVLGEKNENIFLSFADGIIRMTRKTELTGREIEEGGFLTIIRMKGQNFSSRPVYYSIEKNQLHFSDVTIPL